MAVALQGRRGLVMSQLPAGGNALLPRSGKRAYPDKPPALLGRESMTPSPTSEEDGAESEEESASRTEALLGFIALGTDHLPSPAKKHPAIKREGPAVKRPHVASHAPAAKRRLADDDGHRTPPELTLAAKREPAALASEECAFLKSMSLIMGPGAAIGAGGPSGATPQEELEHVDLGLDEGVDQGTLHQQRSQRLQRNREAAQQFRVRKKEYVRGIEAELAALRAENRQLRARASAQAVENGELRRENVLYRSLVHGRSPPSDEVSPLSARGAIAGGAIAALSQSS
jgi:hypothetical protein